MVTILKTGMNINTRHKFATIPIPREEIVSQNQYHASKRFRHMYVCYVFTFESETESETESGQKYPSRFFFSMEPT